MRPCIFFVFLALFGALAVGPVVAQAGILPLDRILPGIRLSHPGRFFDADGPTREPDGSEHYHLKWMTPDGRIEWLDTDARTGRVLGASPGRDTFDGPGRQRYFMPAPSFPLRPDYGARRDFRGPGDYSGGPWRGTGGRGYGDDRERRRGR